MKRWLNSLVSLVATLVFLSFAIFAAGLALGVALFAFHSLYNFASSLPALLRYPALGISIAFSYFVYGISLIFIAPTLNILLGGRLKPYRGPAVSIGAWPWYVHCTMTLVVRLSFLEFVTPSPFNLLFYRLMGMKIGRNVTINSSAIADPSLIELEDGVTIGGSASILAHYAQGGYLVITPVKICKGATIGLRAVVMGAEVGEKAKLLSNSFLLPSSKIPPNETWAGIPAARIEL